MNAQKDAIRRLRGGQRRRTAALALAACRHQLRVFDGVLEVAMPQEEFNGPRILLVVRELIAAPMPELRRMHREPKPGERPPGRSSCAHSNRSAALGVRKARRRPPRLPAVCVSAAHESPIPWHCVVIGLYDQGTGATIPSASRRSQEILWRSGRRNSNLRVSAVSMAIAE